jgi:uncharacterized protein YjiS (DUF1127 family)
MLNELHGMRTAAPAGELNRHLVDDVIMRARRERTRWVGQLVKRTGAWLKGHAPIALTGVLARRRRATEVRELLALDNRTLADIGLRREDLRGVAHGEITLEGLVRDRMAPLKAPVVPLRRPEEPAVAQDRRDLERAA